MWCDICQEMVLVNIDKKEILEGIKAGIYTRIYKHKNPYPDKDDTDDKSDVEHTVLLYINKSYNVAGVKSFFGDSPPLEERSRIPIKLFDKIEMKINLYMLSKDNFIVLKVCDGFNTIEQIADITDLSLDKIEEMIETLRKKRLLQVITRS